MFEVHHESLALKAPDVVDDVRDGMDVIAVQTEMARWAAIDSRQ